MVELDECINRVKVLPPAPELLPELLRLLSQPNVDNGQIVRLMSYDPALTAKVLQLCNSASIGSASPVVNLNEAVVRLGFEQVYRLVAVVSISQTLRVRKDPHAAQENGIWKHSVATAVASKLIAQELDEDRNVAFTAALLHDIGKLILAEAFGDTYSKLVQEVESNQYSLLETEKRVLGVEHAEIGGRLLARWKFPINIATPVCFHHSPSSAAPYQRLAAQLHLGNLIAYLLGFGCGHQALALRGRDQALQILGLKGEALASLMLRTQSEITTVQNLFQISG
jgi:putative nucleotidyltransferase with HDIG domain